MKSKLLIFVVMVFFMVVAFYIGSGSRQSPKAFVSSVATTTAAPTATEVKKATPIISAIKNEEPTRKVIIANKPTMTTEEIVEKNQQSVAYILTETKLGYESAIGSGFVVTEGGKIVTNYHVIADAYQATVKIDGEIYEGVEVVDIDRRRDLAVIKIAATGLKPVVIGSPDNLKSGEQLVAIGNPKGLENSVSDGVYSSTRQMEGYKVLQVTVPISPGSSGGPVFNKYGEVIGVSTMSLVEGQNLNFAVPINYAIEMIKKETIVLMPEFAKKEEKRRIMSGDLTMLTRPPEPKNRKKPGKAGIFFDVRIADKVKRWAVYSFSSMSPALDAGIRVGDVVRAINGVNVQEADPEVLKRLFKSAVAGAGQQVEVTRDGQQLTFDFKLKEYHPIGIMETLDEELSFHGADVRVAVMVSEINARSNPPSSEMEAESYKKDTRQSVVAGIQSELVGRFGTQSNFKLIDSGKIDTIMTDYSNEYGYLSAQVRDYILKSMGVTHVIDVQINTTAGRKYVQKYDWIRGDQSYNEDSMDETTTCKLIDLSESSVMRIVRRQTVRINEKIIKDETDPEDKELNEYYKAMNTPLAS